MKTLTKLFLAIFALILIIPSNLFSYEGDAIIGTWLTDDKDAKIKIYKNDNKYYGKIVWLKEPNRDGKPKMDIENPDQKKRSREIMGLVILKYFVYDEDYLWKNGKIYDPKTGNTYSCKMELSKDKNTLEVRGYIGISLFGRTSIWTRSEE
jgi:uncharacterized protein (DUF2147 family)